MRTLGRILAGAGVGLAIAVAISVVVIIATEAAIARRWMDVYDDATMALLLQVLLMSGPIVGGWWMWIRRNDGRE